MSGPARLKPWEVGDDPWAITEPPSPEQLSPEHHRRARRPGRRRLDDRLALQGVLFVPRPASPGSARRKSPSGSARRKSRGTARA
ncbi:hypothetical protein ACFQ08_21715 [Streptosporangium algeriense]|uniref:Uncharacterized protein n=1 Tax=Streptosporangium algeriense TaxID=1682748 RepID=A0ABW3DTI7_9ACTN